MSVSSEKLYEDPSKESKFNHEVNTGGKWVSKAASYLIAAGVVSASVLGGMSYAVQSNNANNILTTSKVNNGYINMDHIVYSNSKNSSKLCDGKYLVKRIESNDIQCCELNGDYYTSDGRDMSLITYSISKKDVQEASKQIVDGEVRYYALEGYKLRGTKCIKDITEIKSTMTELDKADETIERIKDSDGFLELLGVDTIHTLPYDYMSDKDIVYEVDDTISNDGNYAYALRIKVVEDTKGLKLAQ